jgi:hypothetical protein
MLKLLLSQGILTNAQIEEILNAPTKDRTHPLLQVKNYTERNGVCYFNTLFAIGQILDRDIDWLRNNSHRLCHIDDYYTSISSILGEIRTYGYLLGAGFDTQPIPESNKSTPDFYLTHVDGSKIEVEVNSKQYHKDESKALEEFNKSKATTSGSENIIFREHVITPCGKPKTVIENGEPKTEENVTENVISKIASIKKDEKQFSDNCPGILWLDFQDEIWQLGLNSENVSPLRTWNDEFFSGEIWYGFYGKKGLPIFERDALENRPLKSSIRMRHEGRYNLSTKLDACIISFANDLIILENPSANNPLPDWFFEKITNLRRFNIQSSWMQWPEHKLKNRIENEILRIESLSEIGLYSW